MLRVYDLPEESGFYKNTMDMSSPIGIQRLALAKSLLDIFNLLNTLNPSIHKVIPMRGRYQRLDIHVRRRRIVYYGCQGGYRE